MNTCVPAAVVSPNPVVHTQERAPLPLLQKLVVQVGIVWLGTSPTAPRSSEPRPGCPGTRYSVWYHQEGQERVGNNFGPAGNTHCC